MKVLLHLSLKLNFSRENQSRDGVRGVSQLYAVPLLVLGVCARVGAGLLRGLSSPVKAVEFYGGGNSNIYVFFALSPLVEGVVYGL